MPNRRVLFAGCLCLASLLGACRNKGSDLSYTQAYEQKMYAEAIEKAAPIASDQQAKDREKAALIAGMSAFSLRRYDESENYLEPLQLSMNKDVAGRARATLGLIAQAKGQHAKAATLLSESSDHLDGDDVARAKIAAGDSYNKIGLASKARVEYAEAKIETDDPALKTLANNRQTSGCLLPGGGGNGQYVIQTGAYATRAAAEKQARSLAQPALRARQPVPMVRATTGSNGKPLFAVQIGPFPNKSAAESARAILALKGASITNRL